MDEVKVYVLGLAIGAISVVLWWVLRLGIRGVYKRLDELIKQNNSFGKALVKQSSDISSLTRRVVTNENRLNDHAKRIVNIEIEHAIGCKR